MARLCLQLFGQRSSMRHATRGLAEQAAAVDPGRLGKSVGFRSFDEMRRVDAALDL